MNGSFRFPCRPGGLAITAKGLSLCNFPSKSRLIDIGCGNGLTIRHLGENSPFRVCGVDLHPTQISSDFPVTQSDSTSLPFGDDCFDGALMECSLSTMADRESALREVHRVLKIESRLILSDVYARGTPARLNGCLTRIDRIETFQSLLHEHGFRVDFFEDHSVHLRQQWGQMVFDHGLADFCSALGSDPDELRTIKTGYCLIIARKKRKTHG